MGNVIHKIGAIILTNRHILVGKKKDTFIIPGGKIESGEDHTVCLKRELFEELGVRLVDAEYFGTYEDVAALDPGMLIKMDVYKVRVEGNPTPSSEIEEIRYINSKDLDSIKLGSVLTKFVIPRLVDKGDID